MGANMVSRGGGGGFWGKAGRMQELPIRFVGTFTVVLKLRIPDAAEGKWR